MKTDELLYEYMDELTEKEARLLEKGIVENMDLEDANIIDMVSSEEEINIRKRQENLVLDRIKREMQKKVNESKEVESQDVMSNTEQNSTGKQISKIHVFGKRRVVLLVAVFVLMIGMMSFAKEHDWDIQMADKLGISDAMEQLDGGYMNVGVSDTVDDITLTASQLIGDKNCMWVQLDTNVPWAAGENGYYIFDDSVMDCYHQPSRSLPGGITYYSYDNNGLVSFMLEFSDFSDINRATVDLWFRTLVMYEPTEDGHEIETVICDGEWKLKWDNYYTANTVKKNFFRIVTLKGEGEQLTCIIREVEVSPVSIQIKGMKNPGLRTNSAFAILDSVILEDGTEMECFCTQSGISNFAVEGFVSLTDFPEIDMTQIEYVVIDGEKMKIK